ncbi:hypothetical protein RIF29_13817 [Crotalaria pallida]|uniref:Uncharacterized protein n=1 Tax=Crotalaria pallida TaxID=3830 RepID=A0AAN9IQ27_CROPI
MKLRNNKPAPADSLSELLLCRLGELASSRRFLLLHALDDSHSHSLTHVPHSGEGGIELHTASSCSASWNQIHHMQLQ